MGNWVKEFISRWNPVNWFDEHTFLIVLGIPVGICGGLASVALNHSIHFFAHLFSAITNPWVLIFFPAIGALLSIFFMTAVFRETRIHAVPVVIYSVSRQGGLLHLRSAISHLIGCLCTIAFGGSAGPEAPVVVSGSSIGSNIARLFCLNERQRVAMVGCGIAAAISAIFNAPLAGIIFSIEVVLGEWASVNLLPIAVSSVVATQISRIWYGNQIPFEHWSYQIDTLDIVASVGLAFLVSVVAFVFVRVMSFIEKKAAVLFSNLYIRGVAGGLCVGMLGFFFPDILGEGYETIRKIIENQYQQPLVLMMLLIGLKILATSLTLGTGSAGGVFAPSLVLGCFSGLLYWQMLMALWPDAGWVNGGCFALLGMAGTISAVLHAPLTGIFLIVEITGGYEAILPLICVAVLATSISRKLIKASIYYRELLERGQLLRPRTDARILADISVRDILVESHQHIAPDMRLREFVDLIKINDQDYYPVIDPKSGKYHGLVFVAHARPYLLSPELYDAVLVEEIIEGVDYAISPHDSLLHVMDLFEKTDTEIVPVLDHKKTFLGTVSKSDILNQYRKELIVQTTF
ncbi:MAG: chloride channel protein [bacterium]|jgi:CIC family chloride channel protein|nr:chloride channel protein [bacterium]